MDVFVDISATSVFGTNLPVLLALGGLLAVLWRAKDGAARLGKGLDGALGLSFLACLLGILFSPWQWLSVQAALPLLGGLTLAYLLAQILRGASPDRLRCAGGLIATLILVFGTCFTDSAPALGALSLAWFLALFLSETRRLWQFLWLCGMGISLCFLFVFPPQKSALLAALAFGGGVLWMSHAYGWLPRRRLAGTAFFLCAGAFLLLCVWPQTQPSPQTPSLRFSLSEWVGGQTTAALRAGWLLGNERPLMGWGAGTGTHLYPHVAAQTREAPDTIPDLGNTPAQFYAEGGALALIAAVLLVVAVFNRLRRFFSTPAPRDGVFVCTVGGALGLLSLAALGLAATPFTAPIVPWMAGGSLGLLAAAGPAAAFPRKTRPVFLLLCAALILGIGAHTVRYARACQTLAEGDFAAALADYPTQFAFAAAQADKTVPPGERAQRLAASLKANPYQPLLWRQMALLAYEAGRYDEARSCAQTAYRLAPNLKGILPLLAVIESARGHAERISVLLALESLNDPSFLLENPGWESPSLREKIYTLLDALLPALQNDLPVYAHTLSDTQNFLSWSRTGTQMAAAAKPGANRHPFWQALEVLRHSGTPSLPQDQGWACLLRLWNEPQSQAKILDAWYAAHPNLAYTPQKRAALLEHLSRTPQLPVFLEPLKDGVPNPLWDDLDMRGVFPQRGALPPAVRLPLYDGLAGGAQAN